MATPSTAGSAIEAPRRVSATLLVIRRRSNRAPRIRAARIRAAGIRAPRS
jgi:hypothetical protein